MNLLQSIPCNMGVNLCRRNVNVAKHHLNGPKVGSPLQKMARKGVPQEMGVHPLLEAGLLAIAFEAIPFPDRPTKRTGLSFPFKRRLRTVAR
jgi:hypothetical protein